jgi:hypothetical protein
MDIHELNKFFLEIAEPLKKFIRAVKGQQVEDDKGLIDHLDVREKTRLTKDRIIAHTFMRGIHNEYGYEYEVFKDIADLEDHYFISLDGEGRKEEILLRQTKIQPNIQAIALPSVQTQPQVKKEHFWSRNKQAQEEQPS